MSKQTFEKYSLDKDLTTDEKDSYTTPAIDTPQYTRVLNQERDKYIADLQTDLNKPNNNHRKQLLVVGRKKNSKS